MPDHSDQPPLTEPVMIQCLFCTGIEVEATDHFSRLTGWVELPAMGSGNPERRIMVRVVMPPEVARALSRDLRRGLAKGGH
jgi:hypothetical protein